MEKLNPYYVTGLVDGEGSFYVGVLPRSRNYVGWEARPSFSLSQNEENKKLVLQLKDFFRCGTIRSSKKDRMIKYEVRSFKDLSQKIIPHFDKYQLAGEKKKDYEIFKKAIGMISEEKHLKKNGLKEIAGLAIRMTKNPRRIKYLKNIITLLEGIV